MAGVQAAAADRRKRPLRTLRQITCLFISQVAMLALLNEFAYVQHMAKNKASQQAATIEEIERSIHVIRGQRVILDSDLAILYGVPTHRLNEQVTRNKDRFPDDFSYQLSQQEFTSLISQIAI